MVSFPCNYSVAASLPKAPFSFPRTTETFHFWQRIPSHRCRPARVPTIAFGPSLFNPSSREDRQPPRTLFPGGFKRAEIKVPTLALWLNAEEVLRTDSRAGIGAAISKGFGVVILDCRDGSGGQLYEAAGILKSLIADRAYLLIAERVDIAAAVSASGVVLSDQGIPAIVARNMMMKSRSDSVYLPLVGRIVQTANSALSASFSEGADFLILGNERENNVLLHEISIPQQIKVPIFFSISDSHGEKLESAVALNLLQRGVCGLVMSFNYMKLLNLDDLKPFFPVNLERRNLLDGYPDSNLPGDVVGKEANKKTSFAGFSNIKDNDMELIEVEKAVLHEAVAVIRKASPMMKEVPLLVDATKWLTEPFLLVIVGEFNSGKSTVINALLGRRYLTEGVVPTTNEITLLCYSENESDKQERCERHPDGQFIIYLSTPILKEMNLVDTPGTNVILQRQQRLTEEFVPRADLILFVLSSDRPLTESEVSFLLYTQQWKKKVVFVLNKMDLYRSASELADASSFIKENTKKILNSEDIRLYPVSARAALDAKLFALYYDGRNFEELLSNDPRWLTSGFDELEKYLFSFLDGSTHAGSERLMLKLKTPMAIADRLLHSCEVSVKQELENASQDLVSIREAAASVTERAMKLESESISWRKQALSLIDKAKARVIEVVESTLQLSKVDLISTYGFKGERSGSIPVTSVVQNDIIGPAASDAQRLLGEYSMWLHSQTANEGKLYIEFFDKKWQAFINEMNCVHLDTYLILDKGDEQSIKVVENFSASAAARLLEQEIREAVFGTFGGLGAAGLSASLLTSVLPTTLEDLLALAFCSAGGFLAISNFPARRTEAIEKVRRVADGLARDIDDAMQKDLVQATDKLAQFVEVISKPYQDAAQDNVNRLLEIQEELGSIEQKMREMKVRIESLNAS